MRHMAPTWEGGSQEAGCSGWGRDMGRTRGGHRDERDQGREAEIGETETKRNRHRRTGGAGLSGRGDTDHSHIHRPPAGSSTSPSPAWPHSQPEGGAARVCASWTTPCFLHMPSVWALQRAPRTGGLGRPLPSPEATLEAQLGSIWVSGH